MVQDAIDIYCEAFVARRRHELDSEPETQIGPGVRGVAAIRLLVTDDSAYDRLVAELEGPWRGVVFAFERANRCSELMRSQAGWSASGPEMAMVLRDLQAATDATLPEGLQSRLVNLAGSDVSEATDARETVAMKVVAPVAIASDPGVAGSTDDVVGFLSGLPSSVRVLAAVDEEGVAHATSACQVFGEYAQIFFVNTEPSWRRRGVGRAMTLEALRVAAYLGARYALLHATADGASVYKRLSFEEAGLLTRFSYGANPGH